MNESVATSEAEDEPLSRAARLCTGRAAKVVLIICVANAALALSLYAYHAIDLAIIRQPFTTIDEDEFMRWGGTMATHHPRPPLTWATLVPVGLAILLAFISLANVVPLLANRKELAAFYGAQSARFWLYLHLFPPLAAVLLWTLGLPIMRSLMD